MTAEVLRQVPDGAERVVPMARRDRLVRGQVIVGVVGPIVAPDAVDLVDALRHRLGDGRDPRLGFGFAEDGKSWSINDHEPAEWCAEMVVSIPPETPESILAIAARQIWRVDTEHPVRFVLCGDYVIQVADQALGDGVEFLRRMSDVLALATGGAAATARNGMQPTVTPSIAALRSAAQRPTAQRTAALRKSGRRPTLLRPGAELRYPLLAVLRASASTPRVSTAGRTPGRSPSRRLTPDVPRSVSREKSLWHPDVVVAAASAPRIAITRLRDWAQTRREPVTFSAVVSALLHRAFGRTGVPLASDVAVVVNLRRYLDPERGDVAGNFFSTLRLRVSDPGAPEQVSRAIRSAVNSTRPARALLATVIGRELFGPQERFPREIPAEPRARLVVNNLGDSRALDGLDWKAPPEGRLCACLIRPERAEDIVLVVLGLADALHVSASFHGTTFAHEQVQRALELALHDPLTVLGDESER